MLDRAPRREILLKRLDCVGQGEPLHGLVARKTGLIVVGQVGVMLACKLERRVCVLKQRHFAPTQRYVLWWRAIVALVLRVHICVHFAGGWSVRGEEAGLEHGEALGSSYRWSRSLVHARCGVNGRRRRG
jgi:hypothetical protein